jgi:glycerol-3-phosphate acyltransferase PlsY
VLDAAKGAVAVLVARAATGAEDAAELAGLAAFAGHLFPVWLGFRGGKGVATFLGVERTLFWPVGLIACAAWFIGAALTRISSAGALIAAAATPLIAWAFGRADLAWLSLLLAALIWLRNAENIRSILRGEEPRIGARRTPQT